MAEAAVGATIQVLIENLLTMSQEQIGLVRHFKNDLKKLQKTFSMVNGFLHDAEEKQVIDTAVKCWLRELEALAFEADNVFDEINYHLLSKKVRPTKNKTVKKKVQSLFSCSNNYPIVYRLKLGRRIKDINEKLKSINQQASEFGLQTRIASVQAPVSGSDASGSTETDSFSVDPIILGRENDVSAIVNMLITAQSPDEQVLSVLPIVGMGGLGKTTLARKVLKDEHIKNHFNTFVWVHVPRIFDVLVLLKNILTSMTTENVEHGNREALLKKLQDSLGAKKYLIVLDDIWNEDREKWDNFVNSLLGISSSTGNFMIVTTRSEVVSSIVETLPVHKLKGLSDDDCWSIIKAKALRGGDNPLEFETMGRNIAKRCKGLPLAAKVFGGLLFGKSKDEWMGFEKKPLSNFGDGDYVYKILKLSFDSLPSPSLKKCFAYSSIFPKGHKIEKEQLVELWMAEGFFQTNQQSSNINMEATGRKFFNLLLQNSLLQVLNKDDYDNVTHCNMHDLVHDLSCSVLRENDNVTDGVCQSRYISCKPNGDELLSIPKEARRFVRTLFFRGKISNIEFSDFESLHSLTLSGRDIDVLPISIGELKHLRYLDISETKIKYLPNSIGELFHLQTLRAKKGNYCYLEKLPDSLCYLINLRHLHISYNTKLPPEIGKLTSLQTLPYFHVCGEKGYGISELGYLKDLGGKLEIRNLEKVRDKYEAISANLSRKTNIYELSFGWESCREVDEANDESVLEGLQPHANLKSLWICGFKGKGLPQWTSRMAVQLDGGCWEGLDNLMEIKIQECSEVEELPALGHLPHLKSLYLDKLEKVKSIGSSFYNIKDCSKSRTSNNGVGELRETFVVVVFAALERLELLKMPNLIEWAGVDCQPPNELVVFPRLEDLKVEGCTELTSAPSHFPGLEILEIYGMKSSLPLENICGVKLNSLTWLKIKGIEGLECLPDGLFSNNHNLSNLEIISCPNITRLPHLRGRGAPSLKTLLIENCSSLRELPDGLHNLNALRRLWIDDCSIWREPYLHNLNALKELTIKNCSDLKSIPYPPSIRGGHDSQKGLTSLRKLWIWDCEGLTNLPIEMVESCALSLEELIFYNVSSITNIANVIGCLHRMPRLRHLVIGGVPKFNIGGLSTNVGLQNLHMSPFSDSSSSSDDNVSFDETVNAMLLQFISLRTLTLIGMEHWDCLPDQLQHLTSLQELYLSDYGIEAFPEWFGNLSSLKSLFMKNFTKLKHLPSKQAMLRLSKLTTLEITSCPLLLKETRSNNDDDSVDEMIVESEWLKISHIPYIEVDKTQNY